MKRFLFLIWIGCLYAFSVCAQGSVNQEKLKQQINAVALSMKSLQSDFVQTKYVKMLNDKMVSYGKMYYQQANKLRWEYTSPDSYTFVLNNNKVLLKKGTRSDVINVNQSKFFGEIARIMMNSVVGKCLTDSKSFKTSIAASGSEYVATLLPQQKQMKQMFQKIILHISKTQLVITQVELLEKKGDRTVIVLKKIKKNAAIHASVFQVN